MADENPQGAAPATPKPDNQPAEGKTEDKAEEKRGEPEITDRDSAVRSLQGEVAQLAQSQMGEYVTRGINQLNAETINIFSAGYDEPDRSRQSGRIRFTAYGLDDATASFVAPPGFSDELALLADRNLVILAGPARTGKRTRALRMLSTTLRDAGLDQEVEELPVGVLTNPLWRVPREGTGFLVSDTPGRDDFTAAKVTEEWLRNTANRLQDAGSYLVVVTGPISGSLSGAPNRVEFVLDEWELPDSREILHRRLRDTVPSDAEDLIERLPDTDLYEVLAEWNSPAFAARAATELVEGHRGGRSVEDTVARLGNAEELVHEWLRRGPEAKDLSLALATAVLDNAGYLKVADAAVALYKRLNGGQGAPLTLRYMQRLLVEHSWIQLVPAEDQRRAPSVRFRHTRVRPAVLGIVWSTYDGAREKVLTWLKDLAVHTDVEVRAGAAQAIGILAQQDFQHSVHTYLQPWGADLSPLLRQTAAQGLNIAGVLGNDRTAWTVLEEWAEAAHSADTENLCTTAALAAGGPLGIREPRRALSVLRDFVICEGKWNVLWAVAASAGALLAAGRGDDVLSALREWTDSGADKDAFVKALLVFSEVVRPETDDGWPLLLRTADENRKHLSVLWSRAMTSRVVQPIAVTALRDWIRRVDHDNSAGSVILGLLADISDESPADRNRVRHVLSQCAQDRYLPSVAAATFYDLMTKAEEEVS